MAKFCWGDGPFNIPLTIFIAFTSAIILGAVVSRTVPESALGDAFPTQKELRGVAVVTIVYNLMLYMFYSTQVNLSLVAMNGKPEGHKEAAKRIGDRSVGNTLEQAWPFMAAMWLHALFVNYQQAQLLGWIYVGFRALYVFFYGFYGTFSTLCEITTQWNYNIVTYLSFAVVYKCLDGRDFYAQVHAKSPWLMIPVFLGCFVAQFLILGLLGLLPSIIIAKGVDWEKAYSGEGIETDEEELAE